NPGKGSGPVLDGVSADADLRVGERDDAALEERVFHHREVHAAPPGPAKVSELWHGHRGLPIATRAIGMIEISAAGGLDPPRGGVYGPASPTAAPRSARVAWEGDGAGFPHRGGGRAGRPAGRLG